MDLFKYFRRKKTDDFETLLKKAASDPAYRTEFLKRLLDEKLLFLSAEMVGPEGYGVVQEGTKIKVRSLSDGRIPIFTSTERIFDKGIIKGQVIYTACKARDLFGFITNATFVLNPYSDYGKEFLPDEVKQILDGSIFTSQVRHIEIEKSTSVLIGEPAEYPTKVVESLKRFFADKPEVKAAYVGWIHDPVSGDPPHYIFGIDTFGNWTELSPEIGYIAQQIVGPDVMFDLIQISGKGGLGNYFLKQSKPFYKKVD